MKIKSLALLLLVFFNPSYATVDGFTVQKSDPTFAHSFELQQYVNTISGYQPETTMLEERLQKSIAYYQRVHILKTVKKNAYTVDCIPYAEQPSLIDNPELAKRLLPRVMQGTKDNLESLKKMGDFFDFNTAKECSIGSVAIVRPSKFMLTSKAVNQKVSPKSLGLGGAYTWEQGYTPEGDSIYINTQASQAYFKAPQQQYIGPHNLSGHSLNQFWYTNDVNQGAHEYTTEFGIIDTRYLTGQNITSIFVFASVDGYGSRSCYNLSCPNFVQNPGTLPFDVPIASPNTDFIFQVKHITTPGFRPGFYLTLIAHNPSSSNLESSSTLLGFYPESIYRDQRKLPNLFSAGGEVSIDDSSDHETRMAGNYANPYVGYNLPKQIGELSQSGNCFPASTSSGPAPYGLIWNLGQGTNLPAIATGCP